MPRVAVQDFKASLVGNGSTYYGQLSSASVYGNTAYSVAFWVKGSAQGSDKTVWSEGSSSTATPLLTLGSGQPTPNDAKFSVFLRMDDTTTKLNFVNSTKVVFDNQWHHIVWTDNNGTCVLYIDGVADATNFNYTRSGTLTVNRTGVLARVRNTVANYFNGLTRDVMAFSSVLTAAQVQQLYTSTILPTTPLYHWKMDVGAGSSVTDNTGNGNTLTLTSATFSSDTPTRKRSLVGDNLIKNGDFEYAPPFTAATTTATRWIDGTSGGSTTNDLFRWSTDNTGTASAQFDTSTKYSGTASLKLSTTAIASYMDVRTIRGTVTAANILQYGTPVLPNTSYTATVQMKTSYTSGDATNGAALAMIEYTGSGSVVTTNLTTYVKTTTDWTEYSVTFTTGSTTRFIVPGPRVYGHQGTGTLIMDAWFDDIQLQQTVPVPRLQVQDFKSSLAFNGTSSVVTLPTSISPARLTVSCWFKRDTAETAGDFISKYSGTNNRSFAFYVNSASTIGCMISTDGTGTGTTIVTSGSLNLSTDWHHGVMTYDGTTIKLYFDGQQVASGAASGAIWSSAIAPQIGPPSSTRAGAYTGLQADVGMWSEALTAAQVASLYSAGIFPATNSIGRWKLGEGAGTVANDTSGNANHGTITSATFSSDIPSKKRELVGGNLVKNGDFEYVPPFTAAGNTSGRWIDGTAGGSTTNDLFRWGIITATVANSYTAQFDTTEKYSGTASIKLSTTAVNSALEVGGLHTFSAANLAIYGIPVLPNTSYTGSYWMKTNVTSGSASNGARAGFNERDAANGNSILNYGTAITTTTGWTQYTVTFTTASTTRYVVPRLVCKGNDGTGTLIMDAWFDDIVLTPTVNTTRTLVT